MKSSKWTSAALAAALSIGLTATAEAASKSKHKAPQQIAHYYIAPGDSRAKINRAYPSDPNPPSLRQSYNLRGLKMNEQRH
jgi:hypothetical protein